MKSVRSLVFMVAVLVLVGPAFSAPGKLLVVAPEGFHVALRDFIAHKQKLLATELVSLESILRNSAGADDPEKLKGYLFT